jgi:hypothetical protein
MVVPAIVLLCDVETRQWAAKTIAFHAIPYTFVDII